MNKLLYTIIALFCLCGCSGSDKFILQGELTDYPFENILVVYDEPESKLDTIFPKDGKFIYEIIPDTTTMFRLLSADGVAVPFVADRGDKVTFGGSFAEPVLETKGVNKDYADFRESIKGMNAKQTAAKAEEFIRQHPQSFVSAYLLNEYFAQQENPDVQKIEELTAPLDGQVKDCRIITLLNKAIQKDKEKKLKSDFLGYFSYKDREQKYVSWNLPENGCALINIWASWDRESVEAADSIRRIALRLPQEKFRVVNVSLDYDKRAWKNACREDSKQWTEVCDFKGWNTSVALQGGVRKIPSNILIDRNRKILKRNLFGDELYNEVKKLTESKKK